MRESAHRFGPDGALVGVLSLPAATRDPRPRPAVLLCNSGIVHRVGPNRLYVELARALAGRGFASFRFDFSGIGDSEGRRDRAPLAEARLEEGLAAMDTVTSLAGADRFVIAGLCSGAEAALRLARHDARVHGVAAINPRRYGVTDQVFQHVERRALARHYRRIALRSSFATRAAGKVLRGNLEAGRVLRAVRSQFRRPALGRPRGAADCVDELLTRGVRVYCLHAEADEGLDVFHALFGAARRRWRRNDQFRRDVVDGADHTFTMQWSRETVVRHVVDWVDGAFGEAAG